ncbi:MAG: T9SS type A sorting domain-containing protein, partial [Calditrichae bacterium]|nr:T9SS type A sorting domain-containing protein [Calditrichia bacterium]
ISFQITDLGFVELKIYDVTGKLVRTLLSETKPPGSYEVQWDGKDHNGNEVGSGAYFYRLKAGELNGVRKMLLLR